jgi:hypothetical protein
MTMSKELALETQNYVAKALKVAQENANHNRAWCHREPEHWCKVAQHILQKPTSAYSFIKSGECTKNVYYDIQTELFADPESQLIRNAWASEIAAIQFQGIDTFRESQARYSDAVHSGEVAIDGNELFKQAKALQVFNDIHGKLTGNNTQKIVVEHKTTLDEAEEYARKMLSDIQEAEIVD